MLTNFADSTYILRIPEELAMIACCGIRDTTNVPTKLTFRGVCTRNLAFWNMFKGLSMCTVWLCAQLSSAQFCLVMPYIHQNFCAAGYLFKKQPKKGIFGHF